MARCVGGGGAVRGGSRCLAAAGSVLVVATCELERCRRGARLAWRAACASGGGGCCGDGSFALDGAAFVALGIE